MPDQTDLSIDALIEGAIAKTPEVPGANKTRYGMSFLCNIPLLHYSSGNNQFVDTRLLQFAYFPRMRLLRFENISVPIPPQRAAMMTTAGAPESLAGQFDPEAAEGARGGQGVITHATKSALACALIAQELFTDSGFARFETLTGYEYAEARDLLYSFLPLNDKKVFSGTRNILGEVFEAPFLDDVIKFLQYESVKLIDGLSIDRDIKDKLLDIHADVLLGAQGAWDKANTILDESEEDIQSEQSGKKAYDRRDRRFKDAAEPRDLVCLAHTSRTPIDERPLVNAQKLQESSNQPMTEAVQALTQAATAMATAGAGGINPNALQQLIADQVAEQVAAEVQRLRDTDGDGIPDYRDDTPDGDPPATTQTRKKR